MNEPDTLERAAHEWFAQADAIDVPAGDPAAVWQRARALRRRRTVTRLGAVAAVVVAIGTTAAVLTVWNDTKPPEQVRTPPPEPTIVQEEPILVPRGGTSSVPLADGRILMMGGYRDQGLFTYDDAQYYDPATGTFTSAPTLPEPRGGAQAVRVGDHVYLVGGSIDRTAATTILDFDVTTGEWSTIETDARFSSGEGAVERAVALDGELVVVTDDGTVTAWSPEDETWRDLPTLTGLAEESEITTLDDERMALGSIMSTQNGTAVAVGRMAPGVPTVRLLPPDAESWENPPVPPLPSGWVRNGYVEAAVLDGDVFLWGYLSRSDDTGAESLVARLDLDDGTWATLPTIGDRETPALWNHVVLDDQIVTWQHGEPAWSITTDGTMPAPWLSITTAIDAFAVDGHVVLVDPGYPADRNVPESAPPVYEVIDPP